MAKKVSNDNRYRDCIKKMLSFNDLSENRKVTIRAYIEMGGLLSEIPTLFKIDVKAAETLWMMYKKYTPSACLIGYKNTSYFEGDFPETPVYKLEDLEAEEKMISLKDTTTKLWTWEE